MSDSSLMPCPFCGAPAALGRCDYRGDVIAECVACDAFIAAETHEKARAEWNRRPFGATEKSAEPEPEPKPRRTLADVVANPPEGWTGTVSMSSGNEEMWFDMRPRGGEVASVCVSPWWASVEVSFGASNVGRARDLSRAVADLLDLLAEVSDV